jgi:hypothetical protein
VFCQAGLPYRDLGKGVLEWERHNGNVSLLVSTKKVWDSRAGQWAPPPGIPFGPKARLFLADVNTQAVKNQSPEIDLEKTLTSYVKRLNLDRGGKSIRSIKEAIQRVCAARVQMALVQRGESAQIDTDFMSRRRGDGDGAGSGFDLWFPKDDQQRVLWPVWARLSLDYYELLVKHAVSLDERHYFALSHSAMALDIYAWLAQRLHRVASKEVLVTWPNLQLQFGWHYDRLRDFRRAFPIALKQVLAVYRVAKVTADERGLTLRNSPPPILKTLLRKPSEIEGSPVS